MKTRLLSQLQPLLKDRALLLLSLLVVAASVLYSVYAGLSVHSSDIQVRTHYSAFGTYHFYSTNWYYLLAFPLFGLVILVTHMAIIIKFLAQNMRPFAIAFAWFTIAFLAIAAIMTRSILNLAFL